MLKAVKYINEARSHSSWIESATMDWSGSKYLWYVYVENSGDQRERTPW